MDEIIRILNDYNKGVDFGVEKKNYDGWNSGFS